MRVTRVLLRLAASITIARAAVDLDGSQVVDPVSEDDPSPIADPITYYPDQHDCPLPCGVDFANVHKWTPYHSVDRLTRCELPMLVHFSVPLALDDPKTDVLLRSCTLTPDPDAAGDRTIANATATEIENPKTDTALFQVSLDTAPACSIAGRETSGALSLTSGGGASIGNGAQIQGLLDGLDEFFSTKDNCDESFVAAYHKKTIAGVYVGPGLGKPTVKSALQAVSERFQLGSGASPMANRTVAQLCGETTKEETVFGISIDNSRDLVWVQKTALSWTQGKCATLDETEASVSETLPVKLFDIASAPFDDGSSSGNFSNAAGTNSSTLASRSPPRLKERADGSRHNHHGWGAFLPLHKRATCRYIQVVAGDGCASLAAKCGIRGADFTTFNPKPNLCSTLQVGDYVCCSAGDPYTPPKPDPPKQNPDGTCASYLIQNTDTCAGLATQYGLTVDEIESYNKGKTWGWIQCSSMLAGYNMCLSPGDSPLPPPQQGTECGPTVPGTQRPTGPFNMTELNPCPLKACCSNWGFCGPYPAHCDVHAPPGGGPGTKLPGFESTCVSNCGNEIKQNSGPPAIFSRIGYYESWNLGRKCLWLKAENANTDGSYTHMHWGFAEIDPATWKVVITDPHKQWTAFKQLQGVKRIISFGGWAYSTEPATYNIIRQAIITNRETFATNIAQFLNDEKLDGVDIDWEYPGAPDIMVGGVPIGQPGDGVAYLRFLTSLKAKVGAKSVSIAAPASYWYLKAFPIDRIAAVIDYIVYMTYDLHGQWDYGNVNAFDSCPSGKCIRSHVNLTETRNALSIITKAGVPNNKIFVGESSYGRSFHMAVDGCWGPMCDFTGTRLESDAQPGRCTETKGYISNAEINEILSKSGAQYFHDGASNSDVVLYKGDYVSYMTPTTKFTRRNDWKALNFAGSIDWAVDLQAFGRDDLDAPIDAPPKGTQGCIGGESGDFNAYDLCQFSCGLGWCPGPICYCTLEGPVKGVPPPYDTGEFIAWDDFDVQLGQLCRFACARGFCPDHTCGLPVVDEWEDGSTDPNNIALPAGEAWHKEEIRNENQMKCPIFKSTKFRDISVDTCRPVCIESINQAAAEGRTTNYGCVGHFPLDQPIDWQPFIDNDMEKLSVRGRCSCDNMFINMLADTIIEALPVIAQIGCFIVMSSIKLVLDIGLQFIPGAGKILDSGLDAVTTAAQLLAYAYPPGEDPAGAFEWWLSPCGDTSLVPEEIRRVFDILSTVADGVSSFRQPKNIGKHKGKKGDSTNPTDRSKPKAGNGSGTNGLGGAGVTKRKKCRVPPAKSTLIQGRLKNTLLSQSCVAAGGGSSTTQKEITVVTSVAYGPTPTVVALTCKKEWNQACYAISSAVAYNNQWAAIPCVNGAAKQEEDARPGPKEWYKQHESSWRDAAHRKEPECDVDEFPPRYLLADGSVELTNVGKKGGQVMRYLPNGVNRASGSAMWLGSCIRPMLEDYNVAEFKRRWATGFNKKPKGGVKTNHMEGTINVDFKPSISVKHEVNAPPDYGLPDNPCWPSNIAVGDPGFALYNNDEWYSRNQRSPRWQYNQPYVKGSNGD